MSVMIMRRRRRRRRKVYSGANAGNEEDPERDRATPGVEDLFRRATFLRNKGGVSVNSIK